MFSPLPAPFSPYLSSQSPLFLSFLIFVFIYQFSCYYSSSLKVIIAVMSPSISFSSFLHFFFAILVIEFGAFT
jgi:hypothetical protein